MNQTDLATLENDLRTTRFVILDFSSPGCAPCKKVPALLEELKNSLAGIPISLFEVNVASEPAVAQKFFVLGVPTLIVFRDGREITRFSSVPKKEKLLPFLQ